MDCPVGQDFECIRQDLEKNELPALPRMGAPPECDGFFRVSVNVFSGNVRTGQALNLSELLNFRQRNFFWLVFYPVPLRGIDMLKNAMLSSIFMIFLLVSPAAASETISTFDFNNIDSLDGYGRSVGLAFSGWSLQSIGTSGWLQDSVVAVLDPKSTATITFGKSTRLLGLSFANLNILSKVSWTAYFSDRAAYSSSIGSGIKKGDIDYLGTGYITSLVFSSSTWWGFDTLALDNLSIATPAATPLPGAAVFFVSGLLGMLGLKRRQVL